MATIGGVTCDIINERDAAHSVRTRIETWQVPGLDGYGAHTLGRGDALVRFQVVKYADVSSLETWIGSVEALQGTVVSVTDSSGVTFTDIIVTSVRVVRETAKIPGGTAMRAELMVEGVKTA